MRSLAAALDEWSFDYVADGANWIAGWRVACASLGQCRPRLLRVCETMYDGHFDQSKTKRGERTIPIGKENAEILAALRLAAVDARAVRTIQAVKADTSVPPGQRNSKARAGYAKQEADKIELRGSMRKVPAQD